MLSSNIKLEALKEVVIQHPAFKRTSVLADFVRKFNQENKMDVKILHVPKFHFELNPIEMYWAYLKCYFRKLNEQSTNDSVVTNLILEAREKYAQSDVNGRLFSRFWRIVKSYSDGLSYADLMKMYFNSSIRRKSKMATKKVFIN